MDENILMNQISEDVIETQEDIIEIEEEKVFDIEIDEAFAPIGNTNDTSYHGNLYGRDDPDQHVISAISGLREELDSIVAPRVVYSDHYNSAAYYEWDDAEYDTYGYFVSLVPGTSKISICTGGDVFGVAVESAAFIGGQGTAFERGNSYGLIATSGLVDVRCELGIEVGDYVSPNKNGCAKKSDSKYGYRVIAQENKNGVEYVTIMLGVQADVTDAIGAELNATKEQVNSNYKNIVSAVNMANQAYNKSIDATSVSQEALVDALKAMTNSDSAVNIVNDALNTAQSANSVAAQARAISESAVNATTVMQNEVMTRANDAWAKADYVQKEAYSLCAKIDEHSVGDYSQAYGLTVEQAQGILKPGIIYVPIDNHSEEYIYTSQVEKIVIWDASAIKDDSKVYYTEDESGARIYRHYESGEWIEYSKLPSYTRRFTAEYLYMWTYLPAKEYYGWMTIDKDNQVIEDDKINDASKPVHFSRVEIDIPNIENNTFGYWYTSVTPDDEQIFDSSGKPTNDYKPYTLYKWEDNHWLAVATLKGNVSNRMVSEVYQSTNEIMMGVINPRGGIAAFDARLTDTEATTKQLASWKHGENLRETEEAIIQQVTDDNGASVVIAALHKNGDKVTKKASLTLKVGNNEDNSEFLMLDANNINFEAENYTIDASKIQMNGQEFALSIQGSINDAINNIEIGGSNLLAGTNNGSKSWAYNGNDGSRAIEAYDKIACKFTCTEPATTWATIAYYSNETWKKLLPNTNYVLSFDLMTNVSERLVITLAESTGANAMVQSPKSVETTADEKWHKYVLKYTTNELLIDVGKQVVYFSGVNNIGYRVIKNLQLEVGNKATDWAPSSSDQVSTSNIITSINASEEGVTIKGEKINFDGNVTFSTIASWCDINDKTKINGGQIYTGSITADKIQSKSITAEQIGAGAITADKLDANAIRSNNYKWHDQDGNVYDETEPEGDILPTEGTFLNLDGGNFYTPQMTIKGGKAYFKGEINVDDQFVVDNKGKVQIGNVDIVPSSSNTGANMTANGPFTLQTMNDEKDVIAAIYMNGNEVQKVNAKIELRLNYMSNVCDFYLKSNNTLLYPVTYRVYYGLESFTTPSYVELTIDAGQTDSGRLSLGLIGTNAGLKFGSSENTWKLSTVYYPASSERWIFEVANILQIGHNDIGIDGSLVPRRSINTAQYNIGRYDNTWDNIFVNRIKPNGTLTIDGTILAHDITTSDISVSNMRTGGLATVTGDVWVGDNNTRCDVHIPNSGGSIDCQAPIIFRNSVKNSGNAIEFTSDRNAKNSIQEQPEVYSQLFDKLNPVIFKYNNGTSDRYHCGLIAQDMEDAMQELGMDSKDCAALCYETDDDGNKTNYGIRYTELISMCIHEIQQLKARIAELEGNAK